MSASKQKGTKAETAVVNYLNEIGFTAERRAGAGMFDKGDIVVKELPHVVFEVKAVKRITLAQFQDELRAEMLNAGATHGVLIVKRVGKSNPGEWYWFVQTPGGLLESLRPRPGLAPI